jgi:hypothetical protein
MLHSFCGNCEVQFSEKFEAQWAMQLVPLEPASRGRHLKLTVAEQQKGMEAMARTTQRTAAQIQKVSAQLEASERAPQVVNNP